MKNDICYASVKANKNNKEYKIWWLSYKFF